VSKKKSKSKQKEHPDTKLSILQEIYDTLNRASDIFVGRPSSDDPGMLWLSDDSIDEWNVRAYDRRSDSYIDPRGYGEPEIRQPYHKRKWRVGDLPAVKCWPIRVTDFFAAVDEILKTLVSKLIRLCCQIPDRWKPIKVADYILADDASADAWDELRFLIQEAEAIPQSQDTEQTDADAVRDSEAETKRKELSKSAQDAVALYDYAIEKDPMLLHKTDNDVYEWLEIHDLPVEFNLPSRDTWKRYLRKARKYKGLQKKFPRQNCPSRIHKVNEIQSIEDISSQYTKPGEAD